jgi:hypothetical protein
MNKLMGVHNNAFQKNANISMVARAIWRKPGISRIEIARELDLYRSTVTNIIQTLIDAGVVYEASAGEGTVQGGRKPILLNIRPDMGCVLGLEFQPGLYRAVAVDVFGQTLEQFGGSLGQGDFFLACTETVDYLLPKITKFGWPLLGICVGLPGMVNPDGGLIILSDPFGLKNYNLIDEMAHRYGVPVLVENDANCCAWESLTRYRDTGLEDFVSVMTTYHPENPKTCTKATMEVGLGIVLGGKVRYGKNYAAGELTSRLWRPEEPVRYGLNNQETAQLPVNSGLYQRFIRSLFEHIKIIVPVVDVEAVFLHGDICGKKELALGVLNHSDGDFNKILERVGCRLEFSNDFPWDVARGAASMFLSQLFSIPALDDRMVRTRLNWETIFSLIKKGKP